MICMSQANHEKAVYPTLAQAIHARGFVRRHRGKRFRHLRIYRVETGWCLTKMTKGQMKQP